MHTSIKHFISIFGRNMREKFISLCVCVSTQYGLFDTMANIQFLYTKVAEI